MIKQNLNKNLKTVLWTSITTVGFIFFIIAFFGIGFHYNFLNTSESINLTDIIKSNQIGLSQSITALAISGLTLSGLVMGLMITKLIFALMNKPFLEKVNSKVWNISLFSIMALITILLVVAASLTINTLSDSFDGVVVKNNAGSTFALYLLIFIPILVTPIPMFLAKDKN